MNSLPKGRYALPGLLATIERSEGRRSVWQRYGFALAVIAAAQALSLLLRPVVESSPFLLYWVAVAASAWYGGFAAGMLVALLGGILVSITFMSFTHPDQIQDADLLRLTFFLGGTVVINALFEERRRVLKDLRMSRNQLDAILRHIADGITVQDRTGQLVYANNMAVQAIGVASPEEVPQTPPSDILQLYDLLDENGHVLPGDQLPGRLALKGMAGAERVIGFQRKTTGEKRWSVVKATPVMDDAGDLAFVINLFHDITDLKQAQESLHEQREWLRITLAGIGDGVIATDTQGHINFMNPVAETLTGWPLEEAMGQDVRHVFRIINEETRAPVESPIRRSLAEGVIVGLANHTLLVRRDGGELPVDDSGAPIHDAQGQVIGAVLVFRDVTERRKVEARLRESEERFRILADTAPVLLWQSGPHKHRTHFNKFWLEFTGRTLEQELEDGWTEGVHPDDLPYCLETYNRAFDARDSFMMEYHLRRADGTYRLVLDQGAPRYEPDGSFAGYIGGCADITELRRAEETSLYLAAIVENSDDAIIGKTLDGIIASWNQGAEHMYGYTADEMIGQSKSLLFPEDLKGELKEILDQIGQGLPVLRHETQRITKDGRRIDISHTVSPIKDQRGKIIGASSIARDITERHRAEEALAESEARFRQITENIHEVFWLRDLATNRVLYISPAYEEIWGLPRQALYDNPASFITAVHPADRERVLAAQANVKQVDFDVQYRIIRPDNTERWVHARSFPIRDASGKIYRIAGVAEDITERKYAEAMEVEQRRLAEALRDTANTLNSTIDLSEVLDRILENIGHVVPHDAAEIMLIEGDTACSVSRRSYTGEASEDAEDQRWKIAETPYLQYMIDTRQPVLLPDMITFPDGIQVGGKLWRAAVSALISIQDERIGFIHLVSTTPHFFTPVHADRLGAFAEQCAIAIRNAQLHEQGQILAALQERQRLARDLHDSVTQTLFSATITAEALLRQWNSKPDKIHPRLEQLYSLIRGALAETRALLLELRPASLEDSDLSPLLFQLAEAIRSRRRIAIDVTAEEGLPLPGDVKLTLYRITQEALNNIAKHARATHATVQLYSAAHAIILSVIDNGRGFDPEQIRATSMGLGIMRERAEAIGAALHISTEIGKGTEIIVQWAVPREADTPAPLVLSSSD